MSRRRRVFGANDTYAEQDNDVDSGWRFLSGRESDDYMDDPDNVGVYDVNTIANYDRDIIPHLDAPVGSAFERDGGTGAFTEVDRQTWRDGEDRGWRS